MQDCFGRVSAIFEESQRLVEGLHQTGDRLMVFRQCVDNLPGVVTAVQGQQP